VSLIIFLGKLLVKEEGKPPSKVKYTGPKDTALGCPLRGL
jgi:hypothetical protein